MNHKSVLILILLVYTGLVSGQQNSQKRSFSRNFNVTKENSFELSNKYGEVNITMTDFDSLIITADVEAFGTNEERIRKMYEGIEINITEAGSVIEAHTIFSQGITSLVESFKGMTNKVIPYDSKIEINYHITAPKWLNMRIENRFGDVKMQDNTGIISLTVSNGSLTANSLNTVRDMNLSFCEASIKNINDGNIDASLSGIEIGESQKLSVNSVSSKLHIKSTGSFETKSKSDKISIDFAKSISGDSFFTEYKIGSLSGDLNLAPKFGSVNIDMIKKETDLISVNSGSADITLKFEPDMSYEVQIRHTNSNLVLPEKKSKIDRKIIDDDRKEYLTTGFVGSSRGNTRVKIEANRGNIYLR